MPSDFETYITARLDELEARHRRLKVFSAVLSVLTAGLALAVLYLLLPVGSWFGLPKVVVASRFVLLDGKGRVRGELAMASGPKLQLSTADGEPRATLWVNHDGAASVRVSSNWHRAGRVAMLSAYDEGANLSLFDEKTVTRATFAVRGDHIGFEWFDAQGKPVPAPPQP